MHALKVKIVASCFGCCKLGWPTIHSVAFLNLGVWLCKGDLALESNAYFLALAENRLRDVATQFHPAGVSCVCAVACQDVTLGGHAGVGVVSLHGASLSLPTFATLSFSDSFGPIRAIRVVLPLGNGGVADLFVVYGYQGAEKDSEKLALSHQLLTSVLCEAKLCCSGQPLPGDLTIPARIIHDATLCFQN